MTLFPARSVVVAACLAVSAPAIADDTTPATDTPTPATTPTDAAVVAVAPVDPPQNVVQLEAATGALVGIGTGALTLSYERLVTDFLSIRAGYGLTGGTMNRFGIGGGDRVRVDGHGGFVMVHAFFFEGEHKLELGAGVGVAFTHRETTDPAGVVTESDNTVVTPQASIAYRFQPADDGFFFRIGALWTLGWGIPFGVGAGWAF